MYSLYVWFAVWFAVVVVISAIQKKSLSSMDKTEEEEKEEEDEDSILTGNKTSPRKRIYRFYFFIYYTHGFLFLVWFARHKSVSFCLLCDQQP